MEYGKPRIAELTTDRSSLGVIGWSIFLQELGKQTRGFEDAETLILDHDMVDIILGCEDYYQRGRETPPTQERFGRVKLVVLPVGSDHRACLSALCRCFAWNYDILIECDGEVDMAFGSRRDSSIRHICVQMLTDCEV